MAYRIVLSISNQRVGGSIPPSVYAPGQGILSTINSLNPGVVNGYLVGIYSLKCFSASGCRGLSRGEKNALGGISYLDNALYKNRIIIIISGNSIKFCLAWMG